MSTHKVYYTNDGRAMHVFDGLFDLQTRTRFFMFIKNSKFLITGGGGVEPEDIADQQFQAMYSFEQLLDFGMMEKHNSDGFAEVIEGYAPIRSYALATNYTSQPHFHPDPPGLTLLYYANMKWDKDWGGETMFADDMLDEIIYTSMYVPGRVVIFDSSIPHKPCTPTIKANPFRFTYVINFKKLEAE